MVGKKCRVRMEGQMILCAIRVTGIVTEIEKPMKKVSGVEKTYTKVNIRDQKSDFAYWQTQPYQVRLATLEQIRQEYHRWRYGAEPRFQRVYAIAKR